MFNIKSTINRYHLFALTFLFVQACSSIRDSPKYQLSDDKYYYRENGNKYRQAWIYVTDDSISIRSVRNPELSIKSNRKDIQFFLKRSFDVDVMSVGFKYRPSTKNLPRQLTTDFNGNVFLGYRLDRFKILYKQTPVGVKQIHKHRGITGGLFGGIGSTSITPWTTNNQTTDEYNGLILTRGIAIMVGVNNLTVGLGIGWDYLTDRDKTIWIYQNKPWYGLTLGLNLN